MTRFLLLIAAVGLGLSSPLLTDSGRVQAQVARTDTIRFMAATRGFDYENPISGFREWCYTNYWHQSWSNPSSALDEVAQYQAPPRTQDSCHSNSDEKVDLATFGFTNVRSIVRSCCGRRVDAKWSLNLEDSLCHSGLAGSCGCFRPR